MNLLTREESIVLEKAKRNEPLTSSEQLLLSQAVTKMELNKRAVAEDIERNGLVYPLE